MEPLLREKWLVTYYLGTWDPLKLGFWPCGSELGGSGSGLEPGGVPNWFPVYSLQEAGAQIPNHQSKPPITGYL